MLATLALSGALVEFRQNLLFRGKKILGLVVLAKVRDLGCEYAICYFPEAAYDRSGIELFEREVIPALG